METRNRARNEISCRFLRLTRQHSHKAHQGGSDVTIAVNTHRSVWELCSRQQLLRRVGVCPERPRPPRSRQENRLLWRHDGKSWEGANADWCPHLIKCRFRQRMWKMPARCSRHATLDYAKAAVTREINRKEHFPEVTRQPGCHITFKQLFSTWSMWTTGGHQEFLVVHREFQG